MTLLLLQFETVSRIQYYNTLLRTDTLLPIFITECPHFEVDTHITLWQIRGWNPSPCPPCRYWGIDLGSCLLKEQTDSLMSLRSTVVCWGLMTRKLNKLFLIILLAFPRFATDFGYDSDWDFDRDRGLGLGTDSQFGFDTVCGNSFQFRWEGAGGNG